MILFESQNWERDVTRGYRPSDCGDTFESMTARLSLRNRAIILLTLGELAQATHPALAQKLSFAVGPMAGVALGSWRGSDVRGTAGFRTSFVGGGFATIAINKYFALEPQVLYVQKGTELTGYPNISVYHEFRYHPKSVIGGTWDWIYEHLGIFSWVVEIWSPMREAGITDYKYIDWFRDHSTDDDLKLIRWSDEKIDGLAHAGWRPFHHAQLGPLEIGGWNRFHAIGNPPPKLLERELARFPKWIVWQALLSPKLELVHAGAEALGSGTWKITLVIQNTGWLPAYVSKRALARKVVRGVIAEIALPAGATLASGQLREDKGQLEGKAYKHTGVSFWPDYHVTDDRMKIEWVVAGKAGDAVRVSARHERAGTVRAEIKLA